MRAVRLIVQRQRRRAFADKILKRAFEPYVTTKAKGTGLGLAVVKKIADEHGARVASSTWQTASSDGRRAARGAQVSLSFSQLARRQRARRDGTVAAQRRTH